MSIELTFDAELEYEIKPSDMKSSDPQSKDKSVKHSSTFLWTRPPYCHT